MAKSVLISGALASGGIGTQVSTLCESFNPSEVQFTLFGGRVGWSSAALQAVRQLGAQVVAPHWQSPTLQKLEAAYLAQRLRRRRFDVLLLLGTSRYHAQLLKCVRPHGFAIYNEINHHPNASLEPLVRQMDGLIAVSRYTKKLLQNRFPKLPVRTLSHFFAYAKQLASNKDVNIGQRPMKLVFIGRLDEKQKRPHWLIERWKDFAAMPPVAPARLDIYGSGDGGFVQRMNDSIREQGLSETIQLHGAYERGALDTILSQADLVLNPSAYEGLGLVLLEAMHRGVPVVATEAGGSAELGENNLDSIVTSGNDWTAFCAGVREMAGRLRAGQIDRIRLRQWVEDRYGRKQLLDQWREVFLNPRQFFGVTK